MAVRKSMPTSGLEIILGIPLLDIKLEEMALNAILWILPHNGITQTAFDLTKDRNLNKRYEVDLDFKSSLPTTNDPISCYTDGPKIAQGNTGYSFGIVQNEEIIAQGNGQLSIANLVFQGEILGTGSPLIVLKKGSIFLAKPYYEKTNEIAILWEELQNLLNKKKPYYREIRTMRGRTMRGLPVLKIYLLLMRDLVRTLKNVL